ncbi:HYR domain-containing protein [Aureisphaera galaxeae]|uniref:HYR domain-containing protein n=1 Tax=Aureisphaera galaxeae TaxID=1538023 RepID=UPI0023500206|nr:HYR domain-containing protein [Aureisphaera galaxeae]MDC8004567.1 HYR domain-containing protein [Aureisphaera galaxeae]
MRRSTLLVLMLLASLQTIYSQCGPGNDIDNSVVTAQIINTTQINGQAFTPDCTGFIDRIRFATNAMSVAGTGTMTIYEGLTDANPLASNTFTLSQPAESVWVNFSPPVPVTAGTEYVFMIDPGTSIANYRANTNYPDGITYRYIPPNPNFVNSLGINIDYAFIIEYVDGVAPTAVCQDFTAYVDSSGNAIISAADVDGGSSDDSGSVTLSIDTNTFDCSDVGPSGGPFQAYQATSNSGNQAWTGELGLKFDVLTPIFIDELGAFDHLSDGINGTQSGGIRVAIFDRNTQSIVPGLDIIISGSADPLVNNHRMRSITPVELPAGQYMVVAKGFQAGQLNGNNTGNGTTDDGGGLISFVGTPNYGPGTPAGFSYPNLVDAGPANRYLAGTFNYYPSTANIVTLTATDPAGNTDTCMANVTVLDTISPTVMTMNMNLMLDASGNGSITTADIDNGTTDNCGIASLALDILDFDCTNLGANTVVLTATDVNGNTATSNAVVTVMDDINPTANCQNITVSLDATGNITISPSDVNNGSTDNCGAPSLSLDTTDFDCSNLGVNTVTLTATDASGNSDNCTATVTVADTTPPFITLNGLGTGTLADPFVSVDPTVVGGVPSGRYYFSFNGNIFQGELDNDNLGGSWLMILNYVHRAGDNSDLVVRNADLPLLGSSTLGDNEAGSANWGHFGNTLAADIDFSEIRFFGQTSRDPNDIIDFTTSYTNVLTYVKTGTGSFSGINNPANYSLGPNHTASIPQNAPNFFTSRGNFALTDFPFWRAGQAHWGIRGLGGRWEVDDAAGNSFNTIHRVWVRGDLSLTSSATTSLTLDASGNATLSVADLPLTITDNCINFTTSLSQTDFTCSDVGLNTIQLTATDDFGNSTAIDVLVNVIDDIPPVVNGCPSDFSVNNDPGECGAVVTFTAPTATDNCPVSVTQTSGPASGDFFPAGDTLVEYTIDDGNGNVETCGFTVTVNDVEAPIINCEDVTIALGDDGTVTFDPSISVGYSVDQSGTFNPIDISASGTDVTLSDDQVSDPLPVGFDFNFYGIDYTDFRISSNGFITFNDDTDNGCCDGDMIPDNNTPNNIIALAWEDLDPGNGGQPTENVIRYATLGTAPNRILVVEYFNVDHFSDGLNVTTQAQLYEGTNRIEIHTTEMPTNGDPHTQGVENANGTLATATPGRNAEVWAVTNDYVAFIPPSGGFATDNCDITFTANATTYTCADIGDHTVTITATDPAGNTTTCDITVTVLDNTAPEIYCNDITVELDENGQASIAATDLIPSNTDYVIDRSGMFNPVDISSTATQISLNDDELSPSLPVGFSFGFYGNTYDDFLISSNGFISFGTRDAGCCDGDVIPSTSNPNNFIAFAWDDLDPADEDLPAPDIIQYATIGTAPNRILVVDFINVEHIAETIEVTSQVQLHEGTDIIEIHTTSKLDNGEPFTMGIENATGTEGLAVPGRNSQRWNAINEYVAFIPPGITENCSVDTISLDTTTFTCDDLGDNTVTITITDQSGNTSTCQATVTVEDNLAPIVSYDGAYGDGSQTNPFTSIADYALNGVPTGVYYFNFNGATFQGYLDMDNVGGNWLLVLNYVHAQGTFPPLNDRNTSLPLLGSSTLGDDESGTDFWGHMNFELAPEIDFTELRFYGETSDHGRILHFTTDFAPGINYVKTTTGSFDGIQNGNFTAMPNHTADLPGVATGFLSGLERSLTRRPFFKLNGPPMQSRLWEIGTAGNSRWTMDSRVGAFNTNTIHRVWARGDDSPTLAGNPVDLTLQLDASGNTTLTSTELLTVITLVENCPDSLVYTFTEENFDCSDVGTPTLVTTTITDGAGNSVSFPVNVIIEDNVAPTALCQNITVQLDANGMASIAVADIDNGSNDVCGMQSVSIDVTDFTCSDVGDNNVILTATDVNGNTSTCTAVVTVEDMVAPVAICQNITVQLDANGMASITASDVDNGSNDACGIQSTSIDVTDFTCSDVGDNNVVLTVTDVNGNTSTCTAVVTVEDTVAPTALCQNITVQLDANGMASITAGDIDNGSNDACGIQSTSIDVTDFTCSDVGDNNVVLTVTDVNGNTSTCTAVVTVEDTVAPAAICQNITVQLDDNGMASITAGDIDNGSNDACGVQSTSIDITEFTCADIGDNNVVLTVMDVNGNTSTCTAIVTVEDSIAPTISCPSDVTTSNDPGMCSAIVTFADAITLDNCGTVTVAQTGGLPSGSDFPVGTSTVEFTATDGSGNTTVCTFNITVEDNEAPVIACQDITIQLDDTGMATITAVDVTGVETDNCGVASSSIDVSTFDCSNVGINNVVLTVTDIHGNISTCTAMVTVVDVTAPMVVCQDITVQLDDTGMAIIDGTMIDNGSTDACGIDTYELDIDTFDCSMIGDNVVTLTVTDVNGNSASCTAVVTVEDNIDPEVVCMDITVELDENGFVSILPEDVATFTDNCAIETTAIDIFEFSCDDIGAPITVQVFANDASGNLATCTAQVTVVDVLAPVITCPEDQTVDPGAGNLFYEIPDYFATGEATVMDNCTDPVTITAQDPVAGTLVPDGVYTITLTAEDEYGNVSTCEFELIVESVLGLEDNAIDLSTVVLYPNPASQWVYLSNPMQIALETASIYDMNGRLIQTFDLTDMGAEKAMDISNLSSATYMVFIKGEQGQITKTLIKE